MPLRPAVTSVQNLELAFDRIRRGSNRDYKQYHRHFYPSYTLAKSVLLESLSERLRRGTYEPASTSVVFQPKKSGVLRPITLLTLEDQIVYQALVNRIADKLHTVQSKHALKKRFGALYAGKGSQFFFRPWKLAYGKYNSAITSAFNAGQDWVAEFDLVSFYELIDHNLLRATLSPRLKDNDLLDELCRCLTKWTTNTTGFHVRHGLPQGPEASSFLAECLLFGLDELPLGDVTYLRYVDDVRLMSKSESAVRRAMIKLDLFAKDLGLVPQANKLAVRRYKSASEIQKNVPSALVHIAAASAKPGQAKLLQMWNQAVKKQKGQWDIVDVTKARFALYRLAARRNVLRRVAPLLVSRPDLATTFGQYLRKFPRDVEAAEILLAAIKIDPVYDASASAYLEALDVCAPATSSAKLTQQVGAVAKRTVEDGLLVRVATLRYLAKRRGVGDVLSMLRAEKHPMVEGLVVASVCAGAGGEPLTVSSLAPYLTSCASGEDPDLARFAATMLITQAANDGVAWAAPKKLNPAVADLLVAVGLRRRGPTRKTAVELYLASEGMVKSLAWPKALGTDLADAERRALRLRHLRVTDPTAFVLMLDTFNEVLLYAYSRKSSTLAPAFLAAAGKTPHPDMGNWINNATLVTELPVSSTWLRRVHNLRVRADLSHAKHKNGPLKGKPTKVVSYKEVDAIMRHARVSWEEIIKKWQPLL